jgi:hypothetical protein
MEEGPRLAGSLVDLAGLPVQFSAVAGVAVQPVVDSPGDIEEVLRDFDHEPATVHSSPASVGNDSPIVLHLPADRGSVPYQNHQRRRDESS